MRVGSLFALAGFAWTAFCAGERLAQRLPPAALGRDVALTGFVESFPTAAPGQITFSFKVDDPPPGVPPRVRLTWYEPTNPLAPGDALDLVARLRPPHGSSNPGGFDYERWLMVTNHGATGYVRSGAPAPPAPRRVPRVVARFASSNRGEDWRCTARSGCRGPRHRARDRRALPLHRRALGGLQAYGHEPSRRRVRHARRVDRRARVPRAARVRDPSAATGRELRPRDRRGRERALHGLLRRANRARGARAAFVAHGGRRARAPREPALRRCCPSARRDAARRARLGSVLAAVGLVLAVLRRRSARCFRSRRRAAYRARRSRAGGERCGPPPRCSRCSGRSASRCCRSRRPSSTKCRSSAR